MSTALALALAAATLVQQTDTVVPVDGATRLLVETAGGSITVTTWQRQEVRIAAEHSSRTVVDIDRRGSTIAVDAEGLRGPATTVDFEITVPPELTLDLEGLYASITVEGVTGEVEAETVQGDIRIVGGGDVTASSTAGSIFVDGARGTVEVASVGEEVKVRNASGEVFAETVGGPVILEAMDAGVVEASSVGGRIEYDGALRSDGRYFFATHGGSVTVRVPRGTGATFNVATLHGTLTTDLPGAPEHFEARERHRFTVGGGGALVEVETFGGRISLLRR